MLYLEKFESSAFVLLFVALAYSLAALAPRTALTDLGRPETLAGIGNRSRRLRIAVPASLAEASLTD